MLILTANQLAGATAARHLFDALRTQMLRDIQPVGATQIEFFNSLLRAAWEIRRCDDAELELAEQGEPLLSPGKVIDRIHRVRRQAERAYRQAIAELKKIQTDRAIRQFSENKGLDALPVPIDTRAYIAAARAAGGFTKTQRITFPPVQAALDRVARDLSLGANAWEAWMNHTSTNPSTNANATASANTNAASPASPRREPGGPQPQPASTAAR